MFYYCLLSLILYNNFLVGSDTTLFSLPGDNISITPQSGISL